MGVTARIVTAETVFEVDAAGYHALIVGPGRPDRRPGWKVRAAGFDAAAVPGPEVVAQDAAPAVAYVNEGRWVADCPSEGCHGAMLLLGDRRAGFLCGSCFNAEVGHRYRPVQWPEERPDIEAVLAERPVPGTRNWTPAARPGWSRGRGETVADLVAENEAHGLHVPEHVAARVRGGRGE